MLIEPRLCFQACAALCDKMEVAVTAEWRREEAEGKPYAKLPINTALERSVWWLGSLRWCFRSASRHRRGKEKSRASDPPAQTVNIQDVLHYTKEWWRRRLQQRWEQVGPGAAQTGGSLRQTKTPVRAQTSKNGGLYLLFGAAFIFRFMINWASFRVCCSEFFINLWFILCSCF